MSVCTDVNVRRSTDCARDAGSFSGVRTSYILTTLNERLKIYLHFGKKNITIIISPNLGIRWPSGYFKTNLAADGWKGKFRMETARKIKPPLLEISSLLFLAPPPR